MYSFVEEPFKNLIFIIYGKETIKRLHHKQCLLHLETGFGSINETLKKAKEQDPTITKVDVENFMRKQPNKQIRKYRGSNSYTAPFARFEFQIGIIDMKPVTKEPEVEVPIKNGEPRYAMVVIDIFSKLANVVPIKEKTGPNALSALKESFKKMGLPMSI